MPERWRDRYEPLEVVGSGGHGQVLRALDHQHGRPVALKVRLAGDPSDREQLLSEARILLGLRPHPGLAVVRDDFFVDDRYVVVMDWVEGTDLGRLVAESGDPGLSVTTAVDCVAQVAAVLDHLHRHDPPVVHGDVKPANCILTRDGRVVLVDFCISRVAGDVSAAAGTEGFMAPEVAAGDPPSPAADVYGLAATTFALLTGSAPDPIGADWAGTDTAQFHPLERAIFLGLALDPARRPLTAGELVERLRAVRATDLPTGVVTFLLTDIEGSTPLWDAHPQAMGDVIARTEAVVAEAVETCAGRLIKARGEGDSTLSVFPSATDAAQAAIALQRALAHEDWPDGIEILLRVALHTGEAELREGDYYGPTLNRAARLRALAHGGQILCSRATADLVADALPLLSRTARDVASDGLPDGATLADLGRHRLRGLARPEHVYQLCHPALESEFPPLPSVQMVPNNLSVQLTTFVGRDGEMAELMARVSDNQLVTLTGAGGVGKTRLAVRLGSELLDRFPDGVWFVELASLADGALVGQRVSSTLGIPDEPGRSTTDLVMEFCAGKELLLVLDNCEHVLESAAAVTRTLLASGPAVRVLATSRVPLAIDGQLVWRVPPLSLPEDATLSSAEALVTSEAVRLFAERAGAADRMFTLDDRNLEAVARICRRLDGVPLAIELAAARAAVLSPSQIADRLDDRFVLLTRGEGAVPARQRTLQAVVDWSYGLLTEGERRLLQRISVFAGSFAVEAVEEVCSDRGVPKERILDLLGGLVSKSLITTARMGDAMRFRLNETTREYALEKLRDSGELDLIRDSHLRHSLALVERCGSELDTLDAEIDNVRAALNWSVERHRSADTLALASGLLLFWMVRGCWREGLAWLDTGLGGGDLEISLRYNALLTAWVLADLVADYDLAERYQVAGLAAARESGDPNRVADALLALAHNHLRRGEFAKARPIVHEAAALGRQMGDARGISSAQLLVAALEANVPAAAKMAEEALAASRLSGAQADLMGWLLWTGDFARLNGDDERARARYAEALSIARSVGYERFIARATMGLGETALEAGDLDAARPLIEEAHGMWPGVGHRNQAALSDLVLGELARLEGDSASATRLVEDSLAQFRRLGMKDAAARAIHRLGQLARSEGNPGRASALYGEALAICAALPYEIGIAYSLEALAGLAAEQGNYAFAARLFGAAEGLRERLGAPLPLCYRAAHDRDVEGAREGLDVDVAEAAWAEGRATRLEDVLLSLGVEASASVSR